MDLGKLRVSNTFFVPDTEERAIAELYDIKLTDFKVTRCCGLIEIAADGQMDIQWTVGPPIIDHRPFQIKHTSR